MIYLGIFLLSSFFAFLTSAPYFEKYTPVFKVVNGVLSVLSLSILNWIRDFSIGTDVEGYGNAVFGFVRSYPQYDDFVQACSSMSMHERGYAILNYVVGSFVNNAHVYYLILGLIVNGVFFVSCYLLRYYVDFMLAWLTFLLLLYPSTLNLLRQGVALALVFMMGALALRKHYILSLLSLLLAMEFHESAIIGVVIYLFIVLVVNMSTVRSTNIVVVGFIAAMIPISTIIQWMNSRGYLSDKYAQYVVEVGTQTSILNSVLVRLPFAMVALYCLIRERNARDDSLKVFSALILAELAFLPLQQISSSVFRIALYIGVFKISAYASVISRLKIPKATINILYIMYLVFYFCYQIIYLGSNEIYPFIMTSDSII